MSDKHLHLAVQISGFKMLFFGLSDPVDSAQFEQHFRECVPLCLKSNTQGHILLLRLSLRRARAFRVPHSF